MDVGTGLAIVGIKDVLSKVVGPTADYVGERIRDLVQWQVEGIGRAVRHAARLIGDRLDEPVEVPRDVTAEFLEQASSTEDELAALYLGGILASARRSPRESRATAALKLVGRMSEPERRAHFLFYRAFSWLFRRTSAAELEKIKSHGFGLHVWLIEFERLMRPAAATQGACMENAVNGLESERLIEWPAGGPPFGFATPPTEFDVIATPRGAELFCLSLGAPTTTGFDFSRNGVDLPSHLDMPELGAFRWTSPHPPVHNRDFLGVLAIRLRDFHEEGRLMLERGSRQSDGKETWNDVRLWLAKVEAATHGTKYGPILGVGLILETAGPPLDILSQLMSSLDTVAGLVERDADSAPRD